MRRAFHNAAYAISRLIRRCQRRDDWKARAKAGFTTPAYIVKLKLCRNLPCLVPRVSAPPLLSLANYSFSCRLLK